LKKFIHFIIIFALFAFSIQTSGVHAVGYVKPSIIENLQETHNGHKVTLTWSAATDAINGYVITRETPSEVIRFSVKAGETSYTDEYTNEDADYKYSVQGIGPNRELGDEISILVHTAKDLSAPGNVRNINVETINNEAHITWDAPADWDYSGAAIYDEDGEWVTDIEADENEIHFYDLEENMSYTFYFFSYDQKGNEQREEEGLEVSFQTTFDKKAPSEVVSGLSYRKGNELIFSWKNPQDEDFVEAIVTLPNDKKIVTTYDEQPIIKYKPTHFTGITTVKIQTVDWNGNVSKGKTIQWEDPARPPVEAKNIIFKDNNGVITVLFTPANEYDYKDTVVSLPNGTSVKVPKGKNSFVYKGPTIVGKVYSFTFKSKDGVGNISKGVKVNFAPKATVVNKTMKTKLKTYLRLSPSITAKTMKTLPTNTSLKVLSKGYGSGRTYSYVQIGTTKGYVSSTHLK
jgi:hypothetical protein